jgi:ABC-type glutathione transport system ATPase component
MVKSPLNVIPQWIVSIMQAGVSLGRIAAFLSEDEVPEAVSSLKAASLPRTTGDTPIRIIHGSFAWNSAQTQSAEGLHTSQLSASNLVKHQRVLSNDDDSDDSEVRFELLDVDLTVPEGKLTLVTGPTASGKTALLMALLGEMTLTRGELVLDKSGGIGFSAQSSWLEHKSIKVSYVLLFNNARILMRLKYRKTSCSGHHTTRTDITLCSSVVRWKRTWRSLRTEMRRRLAREV